jgi:hypothetical protein
VQDHLKFTAAFQAAAKGRRFYVALARPEELTAHNRLVAGSNPASGIL